MTTVIRIKRNCSDDPLDTLLFNCKKQKLDENSTETDISKVLSFAGTVSGVDEDVLKHIKNSTKAKIEDEFKKHNVDVIDKLRSENQISSKNSRYKVVSSHRFSNGNVKQEESDLNCIIVDVEAKSVDEDESSNNFVYDLYYTNSDDLADVELNEFISVYSLSEELVYGSYRDNGCNQQESDDSDDSNAENNWRNDYPDESDIESVSDRSGVEDGIIGNIKKVSLYRDDLLSASDFSEDEDNCDESCTP